MVGVSKTRKGLCEVDYSYDTMILYISDIGRIWCLVDEFITSIHLSTSAWGDYGYKSYGIENTLLTIQPCLPATPSTYPVLLLDG